MIEVELTLFNRTVSDMAAEGEKTEPRTIYAALRKMGQSEYFSAQQLRMKPDFVAEVWPDEYMGEKFATIDNDPKEYSIYREFDRDKNGKLELYLTRKIGDVINA